ncbi:BOS complex subunit ncln-like [Sycon ciliatum]|uniref:BOS complex subunit ncln-like n=1 Tax=Sycon ciliatum TaxID=27933 RepID=UPI0031F6E2C4
MMVFSWDETLDLCKALPMFFLVPFCMVAVLSSGVESSYEFDVFRMYQYELHGQSYGCHGSQVNMEARTSSAQQLHRRCVVSHLNNLSIESFRDLIDRGAGSILVIVPPKSSWDGSAAKEWLELEQHLLTETVSVPVYFAWETPELLALHGDLVSAANGDKSATALDSMLSVFSGRGYQMVASARESKPIKDAVITTLVGKLSGRSDGQQQSPLPTLAVVAHYDAHSVSPHLSFGGDSNGSGVVALLELARLFSRLYADKKTKANFDLLFVLTGGSKLDYQGTKQWIDSVSESDENPLSNVHYVLCLDSLGNGDGIVIHVSRPPKEGTPAHAVVSSLREVASSVGINFTMVHKKINLADDRSAWEHERFSIKRIPAATLSWYPSFAAAKARNTIYDQRSNVDSDIVSRNIHFLAEGVAHYIFNMSTKSLGSSFSLFNSSSHLHKPLVSSWLDHFATVARSQQLLGRDHSLISTLEQELSQSCHVTRHVTKADKRDPDFVFYDAAKATMIAHSIKPGIFDLVLALIVAVYLLAVFGVVQVFPSITARVSQMLHKSKLA